MFGLGEEVFADGSYFPRWGKSFLSALGELFGAALVRSFSRLLGRKAGFGVKSFEQSEHLENMGGYEMTTGSGKLRFLEVRFRGRFGGVIGMLIALAVLLSGVEVVFGRGKLRVISVIPDYGWMAERIGGKFVSVRILLSGREDPHYLRARPSFILAASRADLFIDPGMQLTIGYVPLILRNSRNGRIQFGAPGFIDTSIFIDKLDLPTKLTRAAGDVHPEGNPHYNLDPVRMIDAGRAILAGLQRNDPEHAKIYLKNFLRVRREILELLVGKILIAGVGEERILRMLRGNRLVSFLMSRKVRGKPLTRYLGGWLGEMLPYWGSKFVSHHKLWSYFAQRFGLRSLGELEPKPGIPPTASHLREIIAKVRREKPRWILVASYQPLSAAKFVSQKTGVPYRVVPVMVGGVRGVRSYPQLISYLIRKLKGN